MESWCAPSYCGIISSGPQWAFKDLYLFLYTSVYIFKNVPLVHTDSSDLIQYYSIHSSIYFFLFVTSTSNSKKHVCQYLNIIICSVSVYTYSSFRTHTLVKNKFIVFVICAKLFSLFVVLVTSPSMLCIFFYNTVGFIYYCFYSTLSVPVSVLIVVIYILDL